MRRRQLKGLVTRLKELRKRNWTAMPYCSTWVPPKRKFPAAWRLLEITRPR